MNGVDIPMRNLVIAVSGGIGAGKADLGKILSEALDADRASFGAEVRRYAREIGADDADVSALQRVGQLLVLTQPSEFVRRVLAQRTRADAPLVVEGLRHVEILMHLRRQTEGSILQVVHVDTPREVSGARVMGRADVERRLVARYQADITEEQVARIIPQYANLIVPGDLPASLQVAKVMGHLRSIGQPQAA